MHLLITLGYFVLEAWWLIATRQWATEMGVYDVFTFWTDVSWSILEFYYLTYMVLVLREFRGGL